MAEPKAILSTPDPSKAEKVEPKVTKTWMGLDPEKVPESIRPIIQLYADTAHRYKEQNKVAKSFNIERTPKPDISNSDVLELQRLKNAMPDQQARISINKSLAETHGILSAFSGPRMWGKSMLQEKDVRLQNMLEKQGTAPGLAAVPEQQEAQLFRLIESVRNQDPYDKNNPLFDPEEEGKLSKNATEILNIWSMKNLNTKFDNPEELYEKFGETYDSYQKIKADYERVLGRTAQQKPTEIRNILVNGEVVGAVPRFGEVIDKHLSEATNNQIAREAFGDTTPKGLYDLYTKGMQSGMSEAEIREALGSETKFEMYKQNAFTPKKNALPSETYIPMEMTPDGRYGINRNLLQTGVYLAKYRSLKKQYPDLSSDELTRRAWDETRMQTNSLLDENRLMIHRDPDGALRDYLEGRGFWAGAYNLTSYVTGLKTLGATGFDLPDRVAKAAFALALPRRVAGVVTEAGEETGKVREGEFFAPYLGDNMATNSADHLLRVMGFFDEPLTRSFTLAVDDEAKERNEDEAGRPGRILGRMAQNFGTDRHIEFMTADVTAGGRFISEFGEAMYEPILKANGIDAPLAAQTAGAFTAIVIFLAAPSPFEAVSLGIAGAKAGTKAARNTKLIGLSNQRLMDAGHSTALAGLDKITDSTRQITSEEELSKVDSFINELVMKDQTGVVGAIALMASAGTTMAHGVSASLKTKSMERMSRMYGSYKEKQADYIVKANNAARKVENDINEAQKVKFALIEAENLALAAEEGLKAEEVIAQSLKALAESDEIERALIEKLSFANRFEDAEFLGDAFALLRGEMPRTLVDGSRIMGPMPLPVDLFVKKYAGTDLMSPYGKAAKLSDDPLIRTKQVRSLIGQRLGRMLEGTPDLKSIPNLNRFADHIANSTKGVYDISAQLLKINMKLSKYTKMINTLEVENLAPKHVIEAFRDDLRAHLDKIGDIDIRIKQQEQYLLDLAQRKRKLELLTPEELEKFIVDEYNQYLDRFVQFAEGAGQIADLPPKVFDEIMETARGLERKALTKGLVETESAPLRAMVEELKAGKAVPDDELIEGLATNALTTKALAEMIRDPNGLINLEVRTAFRFSAVDIWKDWRAWSIKFGILTDKWYRQFPIFTTNVRYLNATVRREADDIAKGTQRETRNILDSFNQIWENVENPREADRLVRSMLNSTSDIKEIDAKYKVPGLSTKLALTAVVGRSETLLQSFLKRTYNTLKAKEKVQGEELASNVSLDSAIKAFMDDRTLNRDNFLQIMNKARESAGASIVELIDSGKSFDVGTLENIIRKAVADSGASVIAETGTNAMRSKALMYNAIVLGAMQQDFIRRVLNMIGPRFNAKMARSMNYLMGMGQKDADLTTSRAFKVDDYVVFRSASQQNAALMNKMHNVDDVDDVNKLSLDKEIFEDVVPTFRERPIDPDFVTTPKGQVPRETEFTYQEALKTPNKYEDLKRVEYDRAPKLEAKIADLSGEAAMKIIDIKADGTVKLVKTDTAEEITTHLDEIVHRDIELSILDAIDGASLWGLQMATNLGMEGITDKMVGLRVGYQKMVAVGLDENNLQFIPQALLDDLVAGIGDIEKDFTDLMSVKEVIRADLASVIRDTVLTALRWWKTHILTGLLIPRPAYFMNQLFGDFSQMFITLGTASAPLTMVGSLAYVPVFGKAMQDGYFDMLSKLPAGKIALPGMFSSMFNASMTKILAGSEEVLELKDGTKMTYAQFRREAIRAGIRDNIISEDMLQSSVRAVRKAADENPALFGKLSEAGFGFTYMQKIMGHKINNVQTRQRLLLYSHLRINKGLSEADARKLLHESMFDWTHSVGKQEMQYLGRYVLFYTLSKNAMALTFGSFFEMSNIGTKAYLRKYMFGKTRLQRLELITRFMTQFEASPSPFEELTPEQQKLYAILQFQPEYFAEYPFLSFDAISKEGQELMLDKGSFLRTMYGRSLPKATAVEYLINLMDIVGSLSALAVATGNLVDPEGNIIPISANRNKAIEKGLDSIIDQYLVPVYADVVQDWAQEIVGIRDIPASEYGARVKPTDMPMIQLLQSMGLGSLVTLTDDPNERGLQRVAYSGDPVTAPFLSVAKVEIHRLKMLMGIAFPGMSPVEIQALATSEEGFNATRARLEALGNVMNVGKAIFYNGANERYYKLDAVADRFSVIENTLERYANTAVTSED